MNQTGYVGFKFNNGVHSYYGWLRVDVTGDGNGRPTSLSLVSEDGDVGAYALADSLGGQNIEAGQVSAIPEPTSMASGLALLALGAAGVREMRRRRTLAQA